MTTDLIAQLRNRLPAYARPRNALEKVETELARRMRHADDVTRPGRFESVPSRVLREFLEGDQSLDQLGETVAAEMAREEAERTTYGALAEMRAQLQAEVKAAESDPFTVLPMLGKEMAKLVAEARALAPLTEIATPDAATASKRYADADRLTVAAGRDGRPSPGAGSSAPRRRARLEPQGLRPPRDPQPRGPLRRPPPVGAAGSPGAQDQPRRDAADRGALAMARRAR